MPKDEKLFLINFLINHIEDEYKAEIRRKELLESKALGYYTIIGIIMACLIAIQIAFFQCESLSKSVIVANRIILLLLIISYFIFLISQCFSYRITKINTYSIIDGENWNIAVQNFETSINNSNSDGNEIDGFLKQYKEDIYKRIKHNKGKNDFLVKLIHTQHIITIVSGFLLIGEFIILFIQLLSGVQNG